MFLIFHVVLCDHVFKGLYDFVGRSSLRQFTNLSCLVAIGLVQLGKKYF